MAQVQIRQDDVAGLSQKLSRLEPELTEPERALLLYMLSLAAEASAPEAGADTATGEEDAPVLVVDVDEARAQSFRGQFANAFTPRAVSRVWPPNPPSIGPQKA